MNIYLSNEQIKQMISELQAAGLQETKDKQGIIEFLRKYLYNDYADVFEKENEVKAEKIIKKENIEGYILDYFQRTLATKYNIDCCNVTLNYIKAILFFDHIMRCLDKSDDVSVERNMRIKEYKKVYNLFRALASEEDCDLSKHQIIKETTGKIQEKLDKSKDHISHITYANYIYDNFLVKYIEEYKNYL